MIFVALLQSGHMVQHQQDLLPAQKRTELATVRGALPVKDATQSVRSLVTPLLTAIGGSTPVGPGLLLNGQTGLISLGDNGMINGLTQRGDNGVAPMWITLMIRL